MTTYSTTDELDALPVGTAVLDVFSENGPGLAYWVKYPDGTWHLIEQDDPNPTDPKETWPYRGYDWTGAEGDPASTVVINGPVKAVE